MPDAGGQGEESLSRARYRRLACGAWSSTAPPSPPAARGAPAYLHTRTGGRIGSLARLLRQAAITAILDSSERITKASRETITLAHLAVKNNRP
ncbi:hypothetical protein [Streptomyces sp. NPDC048349]|uniref:hypothetical protein n=1 Tax=Streptomyces sp. NPDC048349 TaxID=3155486 RepID=UPI00344771A5